MIKGGEFYISNLSKRDEISLKLEVSRSERVLRLMYQAEDYVGNLIEMDIVGGCAGVTIISLRGDHILPSMEHLDYSGNFEGFEGPIGSVDSFAMELAVLAHNQGVGIYLPRTSAQFFYAMNDSSTIGAALITQVENRGHTLSVQRFPKIELVNDDVLIYDPDQFLIIDTGQCFDDHPPGMVKSKTGSMGYIVGPEGLIDLYARGGRPVVLTNYDYGSREPETN